jgi:hypothetical protein
MKNPWLAAIALLLSTSLFAQDLEELKQRLQQKEAEVEALRSRIQLLERKLTLRQAVQPRVAQDAGLEDEDINRALERSLVREGGLVLSPKTFEIEPNFVYSHLTQDGFRRDSWGPGLTFRAGLPWRSQLEAALPYVVEYRSAGNSSTHAQGFGDLALFATHQILGERPRVPSLVVGLGYQPATGRNTLFEGSTPVALGSGFDAVQAFLTAVKRADPLVFFGTYTFTHNIAEQKAGEEVEPGNSNSLRLGTILATSPTTSLRAVFNMSFFNKTRVSGFAIPGSDDTFGLLEFGGSVVLSERTALDVAVGAGVTRNAPDFRIGVALPIRF